MIYSKLLMVSTRVIMVEIMKVTRSGFKKKKIKSFGYKFEMSVKHPSGAVNWAVEYTSQEFREVQD